MNRLLLLLSLVCLSLTGFGQGQPTAHNPVLSDSNRVAAEAQWVAWQKDLYEMGVSVQHDSIRISPVVKQLFTDSLIRKGAYPTVYTWPVTVGLLQRMELKQAFWHLINLYPTDSTSRHLVLQSVLAYDKMIDMNKAIVSSFYTYAFADPTISALVNGKPDIRRPDLLDKKLHVVREITEYVTAYRKTQSPTSSVNSTSGVATKNLSSTGRTRR